MLLRTLIAALVGGYLLERLNVPAGAMIGAMLGVAALNLSGLSVAHVPEWARFLSFVGIGWALGQQFTRDSLQILRESFVVIVVVVAGLLIAGGLLMLLLRLTGVDVATAFLAASPGGISQMGAISADVGAVVPVVMTTHLIRIFVVVLTAPIVVRFLTNGG